MAYITKEENGLTFSSKYERELKLYYGIEWEFSGLDANVSSMQVAREMQTILASNGIKSNVVSDCSVRGKEVVMHPCTYSVLEDASSGFVKIARLLNQSGWNNNDSKAGGHIHISRRTLGKSKARQSEVIDNMIAFFRKHRQGILKLSRRTASDFNQWSKILDNYDYPTARDMQARYPNRRYQAINLCNQHTVEFRIFKGFTSKNDILGCAQFVNLLVNTAKAKHKDLLGYESLNDLIEENKRSHRELYDYWKSL